MPVIINDNRFLFKNNIEYAWAKFMQVNKMIKRLMGIFFNNPDLAPMWKYLSYQNVNEMRTLLTELVYDQDILLIKSLNIYLLIANMALKEYLIYYLDIIPAIYFLINHQLFVPYGTYALV